MIRKNAYFICEEYCVIERLNPHTLVEKPSLLGSNAFVHVLHQQVDAIREVTKGFLNIDDSPPSIGHRIEACVSSAVSFSHCICKDDPPGLRVEHHYLL